MSDTKSAIPLCQDCKHVHKSHDNTKFWRCKKTSNGDYEELLPIVSLDKIPPDLKEYGYCVAERKYDLTDGCGPSGKWFEKAEAA